MYFNVNKNKYLKTLVNGIGPSGTSDIKTLKIFFTSFIFNPCFLLFKYELIITATAFIDKRFAWLGYATSKT